MAESAALFLLNQLALFLREEQKLLRGIGDNAVYIRDELGQMRAFLRVADEKEENDPQLKEWVKKVREITYDTEDVLDRYMLDLHRDADGYKRYIKRMYAMVKTPIVRHQIASEFQKIKLRMENVAKTLQIFKEIYKFKDPGSSSTTSDTRGDALLLEEEEVVGIEEPKKQLVEWLKQTDDGLVVISVVGMGGLGKTTLVKKVYDDASAKANFDCHVWVTVSENFNSERLLRDIINQLVSEVKLQPPANLEAMNGDGMKKYVYNFLKDKTYMIVLDDVWKIDVWESIRYAFPRKSACGRIIIMGHLEKLPRWVSSLHGLASVLLMRSRLREDPLQHLEDLPNLVTLQIRLFAYEGEELIFKGRKFQKLERLRMWKLRGLRSVRVEKDSMPHLKDLHLWDCEQMEELPEGIERLRNLQHVEITTMSEKFNGRFAEQRHRGEKLADVPKISILG